MQKMDNSDSEDDPDKPPKKPCSLLNSIIFKNKMQVHVRFTTRRRSSPADGNVLRLNSHFVDISARYVLDEPIPNRFIIERRLIGIDHAFE